MTYRCSNLALTVALVLSSALVGCVPIWTGNKMQEDIEAVRTQQKVMTENYEKEKAELTQMVASARSDITEMRKVLKEARAFLQRNNADLGVEIQETRQAVERLNGKLEELEFTFNRLEQNLELFKEDVDIRFSSGEAVAAQLPDDAAALFAFGEEKFEQGQMRAARKAFERLLSSYPSHGRAADARFLVGETYFNQEQWVTAIFEYQKVLKKHSSSNRAADATFRMGEGFVKMNKCDEAKAFFETVVSDYGNSKWTSKAHQYVNNIAAGRCP